MTYQLSLNIGSVLTWAARQMLHPERLRSQALFDWVCDAQCLVLYLFCILLFAFIPFLPCRFNLFSNYEFECTFDIFGLFFCSSYEHHHFEVLCFILFFLANCWLPFHLNSGTNTFHLQSNHKSSFIYGLSIFFRGE